MRTRARMPLTVFFLMSSICLFIGKGISDGRAAIRPSIGIPCRQIENSRNDFPVLKGYRPGRKPPGRPADFFVAGILKQGVSTSKVFAPDGIDVIALHQSGSLGIPSGFDWRDKDIMTPVKHQMNLGSCGVFAAVAAASLTPGQNLRQITADPAPDYHVKWSPDGKMLAFTSQRSGEPKIWLVPAEGGDATTLETGLSGDHHISWAPDGKRITFDARWEGRPNIFMISIDGGQPKRLSPDGTVDFQPYWSPDGSRIAFASTRSGNVDIWIMPAEGGSANQLTHSKALDAHPVWSPDGSKIAFTSERSGNLDIWIMPASGGEAWQLTSHEGRDHQACWSPDGARIAFMSERGGKRDIWIVSVSGGEPIRFTGDGENSWPSWSPDGGKIAFASNRAGREGDNDIWIKGAE